MLKCLHETSFIPHNALALSYARYAEEAHFYHSLHTSLVPHKRIWQTGGRSEKKCNNFSIFHELSFAYPDMFQNALVIFAYFAATLGSRVSSQENKNFPLNKSH